jgi:glycosyltransferase involved in cell wall biosynthesis
MTIDRGNALELTPPADREAKVPRADRASCAASLFEFPVGAESVARGASLEGPADRWPISTSNTEFILLSFEGPDRYSRAGGLGTRTSELAETLAESGFTTHLFFIGDPNLPLMEARHQGRLQLYRWCQWISRYHPLGVYDGEEGKHSDFTRSLPPFLVNRIIEPRVLAGKLVVIMAEEWQTADAVCRISSQLRERSLTDGTIILWNANNTFGFERIDWVKLSNSAKITTVSRYMKHIMRPLGVDALVIPNGIPRRLLRYAEAERSAILQKAFGGKLLLAKVARWDPDKGWDTAVKAVALLKSLGVPTLLLARGGIESYGEEMLERAVDLGLVIKDVVSEREPFQDLLRAVRREDADVLNLKFFLDEDLRGIIYSSAHAVLANSTHEPFGLVGLETMAVGGIAFTGSTGEDYARPYENAVVLETPQAEEIVRQLLQLQDHPEEVESIRLAGRSTAKQYTWERVIDKNLLTRLEHMSQGRRIRRPERD